jgi:hypothetical protein
LFDQVADAGNLGGGMLSYLLNSSVSTVSTLDSLFFLLSFLLKPENDPSLLDGFSVGLSVDTSFGVTEKLGARGPLGFGAVLFISAVVKLGRMKLAKSFVFGREDETKGEILRSLSDSKLKAGRLGL